MSRETRGLGRQAHRDDHLAALEHILAVRCVAGQAVEHVEENFAPACLALDFNNGIKRDQRNAEIRGVRRYAALAPAQYGVQPVVAATGVAARARTAFVAGAGDLVELAAARSPHEIAPARCSIAKLRGGSGQERLSNRRK